MRNADKHIYSMRFKFKNGLTPDKRIEDMLQSKGEFSIEVDIRFNSYLKLINQLPKIKP